MNNKINFAVVGCGHIGKRHAAIIQSNPYCHLTALCDVKPFDQLGLAAYHDVPFFSSIEKLLVADILVDVVCICTPNGWHASQAIQVLQSRKHVVCEKPMALTKTDCDRVIHTAHEVFKQVFCVMQNRYSPPSVWLKDILTKHLLGNIYMVQINCFWNRDRRYYEQEGWKGKKEWDGGTLFTQFSHFIDMMYWLFGDIDNIKAVFKDFNHQDLTEFEDSGIVTFDFVNGGIGSINYSTSVYDKNLESSITIIGENGSVKVGGQYMNTVEYCHIKDYTLPMLDASNPPNDYGTYQGSAANHHYIFENVVETLNGDGTATTNALEGSKVVEIIERIYNSGK
ncbi:MAG TPA: Gfo/Idh/MocA family oxidoreductase [Cytophagaceae bacterium]|jgi:UDP-N-acetyl-2-amino-2-deoxyglucuronate dehydrogenase|nr:Gfo/Idh/MocA family oxidoreductase [Cytophagaceae bacterium]